MESMRLDGLKTLSLLHAHTRQTCRNDGTEPSSGGQSSDNVMAACSSGCILSSD